VKHALDTVIPCARDTVAKQQWAHTTPWLGIMSLDMMVG
jgi:hypothetical protein